MKNYRKHIDDFFRERLGRYRETPPPDVWDDLEGRLDTLKPYVPKPPMRWLWHLSMVSLIAVLGVSLTRKFTSTPKESQPAAEQTAVVQQTPASVDAAATTEQSAGAAPTIADGTMAANPAAADNAGLVNNDANGVTGNESANSANSEQKMSSAENANEAARNANARMRAMALQSEETSADVAAHTNDVITHTNSVKAATAHAVKSEHSVATSELASNKTSGKAGNANSNMLYAAASRQKKANHTIKSPASKTTQFFAGNNEPLSAQAATNAGAEDGTNNVLNANVAEKVTAEPSNLAATTTPAKAIAAIQPKPKQKELAAAVKKLERKEEPKQANKPGPKRFDFGIKGGYEMGVGNQLANKWAISPFVQYHLSSRWSLMTQPGVKFATIADRSVGSPASYYVVNPDGKVVQGATTISVKVIGSNVDTYYHTKYTYSQSHDSIVKTRSYGGSYKEFEIPLLVQYSLNKEFAVYGGVNLVYSQRTVVNEHTNTYTGIVRSVDSTITNVGAPGVAPALNDVITYSGNSFAEYTNTTYPMKVDNVFRLGYMIGLTYQYSNRWLFDAMLQQTPMRPDVRDGFNLNRTLSAPYLRLSVGYKISK